MNIFHKPKIIIPLALVAAIIIGAIGYGKLGKAPVVTFIPSVPDASSTTTDATDVSSRDIVDLAFPKTGRISTVDVQIGQEVKQGQTLASLDATDTLGALNQAKGALELAKAQAGSLNVQYVNTQRQQDVLVANAYRTLLSSGLAAIASPESGQAVVAVDNNQIPTITGTYNCEIIGRYEVTTYQSGVPSGYSFTYTGLEAGSGDVTFFTPQPLGSCGLSIQFPEGYSSPGVKWVIDIPNTKSSSYATNKNAYDLAVTTREQMLTQLEANLGRGAANANTTQATIDAAEGTYLAALGAYENNFIVAPYDGVVSAIDSHLKIGQIATANKTMVSIRRK